MENMLVRLLPRRRYGVALRYAATCLIIAITALLRYSLDGPLQHFPLLLFVPAVFLCALLFDRGSGFFATLLSAAMSAYFFIEPYFSFAIGLQNFFALFLFIVIGFTMSLVTEALRETIRRLDESERAKALLLEELAHRTKNDLAIISSAITLQSSASRDPAVREALSAANARVLVVAQAQERLRGDVSGGLVGLSAYVGALCHGLGDLLRDVRPIAVRVNCVPISVPSSVAVHVGLIVNELVTNSLKYAYPTERGGVISVDIASEGANLVVTVADDGVGCPAEFDPGLGSKLVRLLAKQLGGRVERENADPGCRVRVTLDERHLLST
ncbi:sensor histidine kinase [Sphingomonas sp. XXL09]|uniref:sensor histidine kinase n=1 Tax=Sphingomonas sp. XXL09 TaxID=3457787 RepID=UPI00406BD94F